MARAITLKKDLPAEALPVAERIELLGFGWRYVPEARLADLAKRVQVRDTSALAPQREVARYATAMKRGDVMPPVVTTLDGYLVDGATRTEAARKAGKTVFPAFQLDTKFEGAPAAIHQSLVLLGSAFNLTHGRGMSAGNVENVILAVAEDDDSPRDIARKLHISESTVQTVMNAMKARKRLAKLNFTLAGTLTPSHLKMLGGKSGRFTDPVFVALAALAQDAGLSLPATNDLCKRLEGEGTEQERLDFLAAERASYRDVINGAANVPSRAAKLRRSLGYLLAQDDPGLLVELSPSASGDHVRALVQAAEKIQRVLAAQRRADLSRSDARSERDA